MKVSLKKYLIDKIESNDIHIRELLSQHEKFTAQSERFQSESLKIFKETNDIHLANLNDLYARTDKMLNTITTKMVSIDEFSGYKAISDKYFREYEKFQAEERGKNKSTDKDEDKTNKINLLLYGSLIALISSIIAIIISNLLF